MNRLNLYFEYWKLFFFFKDLGIGNTRITQYPIEFGCGKLVTISNNHQVLGMGMERFPDPLPNPIGYA